MAVRLSCLTFLLEEAKREDNLEKRRQAKTIRNLDLLTTEINFIKVFRLTEELITQLEENISPFLPKAQRRGGISNRTKILCTLAFLASGSYQKILAENARTFISQTSVSRAIRTVVDAINHPNIINKYIRFPQFSSERQILKEKFYGKYKIPGIIGCIDGTLVSMVRPKEHEERYYCRKGYHARNAVIINDPDLNIMHVDVTFGGATHDNFIFTNSVIKTHLEQLYNTGETVYLLGRALFDRLSSTTLSEVSVASEVSGVLLPAPLDVAPYSTVTTNATCGDEGTEEYCRETPGKRGVVCEVCEGPDGSPSRRHPPSHVVDSDPATWWQSPSLAVGEYDHVEMVARLPDKMELLHVIIKSGPSPRPLAWSLEVSSSKNGEDWRMIRAFGDRDHCRKLWDLRPERRRRKARAAKRTSRADKLTCSTQFASPRPLENGEMHVAIGEGVSARRVRISFRAAHASSPRQQYYTVRGITLAARCLCHGHAASCDVDGDGARCSCEHGTCGARCDRCCAGTACGAGRCDTDDTGVELCVNCTDNRAGPLCDKCLFGYYNAVSDGPCEPCNCDPLGSDGSCDWDRKHHRVSCKCLPGFTGAFCEKCDSDAVYPDCQTNPAPQCKCDPRGIIDPERVCDEHCECKVNVVGERCDTCAPGHFGLSHDLPSGCRPCYCSHMADSCTLDTEFQPKDVVVPVEEGWLVTDALGNETVEPSVDDEGHPFIISYEVEGWEHFYWLTSSFNGEQFQAYGGEIRVSLFWGIVRGDTGGNPTYGPDIVLIGADGTKIACTNNSHETPGQLDISVPVLEGSWYTLGEDPELVSRIQLMDVLSDVRGMMIRGHYHFDQDEVRLHSVLVSSPSLPVSERCVCPAGYAGAQCAACAWGHVHTAPRQCLPCACNRHADCQTVDGPCGPCQHNTTGPNCERCLPGHYGNPVQGSCKPCACPLFVASNNFSPNCVLASAEGDDYVCTQCPDGYSGDHCENCDFGYWGSPTSPGRACRPCACGGSPCHPTTGECLTCPANTEGAKCDLCKEGYWVGPNGWSGSGCERCACGVGALSAACDATTGACACKDGWTGRGCDTCDHGYGGITEGCPPCRCGVGAVSHACDTVTGVCACAAGAAPPRCDTCLQQYYGLNAAGCSSCNCSTIGSESNVCDIRSGQCRCRQHVTGRACDTCVEGYWGLERGGCKKCDCGVGAAACDPVTGACACAPGVGGAQCDVCLPGFYGFGPTGCLPCPICNDGKVCSPASGRCVCPSGSRGVGCGQCARGYRPIHGRCRLCTCGQGAVSNSCDSRTGQCQCRAGWSGIDCNTCAPGHYGPRCKPCHCVEAGTRNCSNGTCGCDQWGRCPCKENVIGEKCSECLEGTFGLSVDNPVGCTACYCFGRVSRCTQAQLARGALHAHSPTHLTLLRADKQHAITNMDQDSLLAIHTHSTDATISLPQPPVPVYMELDRRFLGDRVTSYGGYLRFKLEEEGGSQLSRETMAKFPLVRIYGKNIVLDYYEHMSAINGTYAVRLHESLWRVRGARLVVASRAALMVALHRVDRLLIRATTRAPAIDDPVHALLLNVSLDTAIPGLSRSEPALGVELCDCPRGYAASSCQEPAVGFWMPSPNYHMTTVAGTIVIHIEGEAQPCNCNNRATQCDPNTGHCLNCTHGTGGPRCAECAAGWYGTPRTGCKPCACPRADENHAAACAHSHGQMRCLCLPGYAGHQCEICADGYYRVGSECVECGCDERGAWTPRCDSYGRCECKAHAVGIKCDRCGTRRTFLGEDGCSPCDNCTQTLLDTVEAMSSSLRIHADPAQLSRIPKPFPALREFSHNASTLRHQLQHTKNNQDLSRNLENTIANLDEKEHNIFTEANRLKTDASRRKEQAGYLSLESMSALEEVLKQRRKVGGQVAELDDFARGERHLSAHRALKEARHLLRQIKDIGVSHYFTSANDVFDLANVQSTAIQEYNYRIDHITRRLHNLLSALDTWEMKSADLPQLAQTVWKADDAVAALKEKVTPKLSAVKDVGLRCRLVLEDIETLSSQNLTDAIRAAILRAQTLSIRFPSLAAELEVLSLAAEEKEGILYNLTPSYKEKYLEAVKKHVAHLAAKAEEYKNLFAGSRRAASRGVSAAQAWAVVAQSVREAQRLADAAEYAARAAAALARGPQPLAKTAAKGEAVSLQLRRRGAELLAKAEELQSQLSHLGSGAGRVAVVLRGAGWEERALVVRPRARVAAALAAADQRARRVLANTRALYDEASEIRGKIRYNLRPQLAELQKHGDTALGAAEEHVSQIRSDTQACAATVAALEAAAAARRHQHEAAATTHAPARARLHDMLRLASHIADTISVSVKSVEGTIGCSRAFSVWGGSAAATRLAMAVSFENNVNDGALIYLVDDTQEKERYMRLYVQNKRLHLRWDMGAGEGNILHPEVLRPTHDDVDHTSYRIEIERIWNTVNLKVERAGGAAVTATNSTGSGGGRLAGAALWLGAPPGRAPGAPGGLTGCVHALYSDDITLGLWNFHHQPKEAKCTGCTQRWYSAGGGGAASLAWFGGRGYAALQRSHTRPADRRQLSIAFTFRTRDENALLFAAIDKVNNRSVSVMLVSCRVEFVVEYGGARLRIAAGGRHCDNKPKHVQAIRVFANNHMEKGSLRVNGEETLGSPVPAVVEASALPELSGAEYWVGGAPPASPVLPPALAPPLLGCLGALTVDREGYDLLAAPRRHGLEPHCGGRILRTALLEGSGYIELPSPAFRRKASLGLSFLSHSADGLLLYRSPSRRNEVDEDGDDKHYLALMLVKGDLQLIAAAGKAELRLKTNGTKFDDKRMHTIRIVRLHKQLEIWVDEVQVSTGVLPGNAYPARDTGLYLGGVGGEEDVVRGATARGVPVVPFSGTLADLIVDSQILGMETAVRWKGAGIGRGGEEGRHVRRAAPKKHHDNTDDAGCTKSPSFTVEGGAVKFGDTAWSHTTMRTRRSRKLTLVVQIRTYAPDGLILLVPGSKNKPKHYCALVIREGRLHLIVRGRKRKEITLNGDVTDGKWRTVSISLTRSRMELTSEGEVASARAPPLARAQRLYVGGIPPPPTLPNVPNSIIRLGSFRGCMRRVSVNGRAEDLVRDARAHHRVGQCFPNVERGAYFGGDAFATWSGGGGAGEAGELSLEFRTTERSGVLLAAPGLLLEVRDGALVLSRWWAGSEAWSARVGGACGGGWVRARAWWRGAALRLAAGAAPPARAQAALLDPPPPPGGPIYLAGLPEGTIDTNETSGKANFKGCIRNVTINGQSKDWTEMEALHNVLLDSCPIQP